MKITAKTRYGLRILLDIAQHGSGGSPRTMGEIAASQGISPAFTSRIAVPLKRAGLIAAERGAAGGLRLARRPEDITLLDISEALDGPVSVVKCLSKPKSCRRRGKCPVRRIWDDINSTIKSALASVTLASALKRFR